MKYRLEFNEKSECQWNFEREWDGAHEENTHGWQTIAKGQDSDKLSLFVDAVESFNKRLTHNHVLKFWTIFEAGYCKKFESRTVEA